MTKYTVTVYRRQTFIVEAENVEDAHQLFLDGEIIDDEITDIFSEEREPTYAERKAAYNAFREAERQKALSQTT